MAIVVFLFGVVAGIGYLQQDEIKITFKVEKKQ